MKTFAFTDDAGTDHPQAVADWSQMSINREANAIFVRLPIWGSLAAKEAGKVHCGVREMRLDGADVQDVKRRMLTLFGAINTAVFQLAVERGVLPADAADV
jgi:hypothetical protein